MKKVFGGILLAISVLNLIAIIGRSSNGESVGSPLYIILIIMMFFGGIGLLATKKTDKTTELPAEQKDE